MLKVLLGLGLTTLYENAIFLLVYVIIFFNTFKKTLQFNQFNNQNNIKMSANIKIASIVALAVIWWILPGDGFSQSQGTPEENTFKAYWDNGFKMESKDKQFKLIFGGRIMNDWAFFSQDDTLHTLLPSKDGTEFRRARFYNSGVIYKVIKYKIQLDFAGGDADFKDVYLQFSNLPLVGNFKVGHFKEPFGLEELTSSNYVTFMERSLTSPFTPARNTGGMLFNSILEKRMTWAFGVFRDAGYYGNATSSSESNYNVTGRVTGLPYLNSEKSQLLHLGLAFSYRTPDAGNYSLKSQAESHLAPKYYVNTGTIGRVHGISIIGTELAFVMGPFSIQGEYMMSSLTRAIADSLGAVSNIDNRFSGFYGMASFFLTKGDHRNYKGSGGVFSRVKPKNPFLGKDGGTGAFEVGVRYSGLDLVDGKSSDQTIINGGVLNDISFEVNWYLNPTARIMANYVMASVNSADIANNDNITDFGNAGIFQMRFQIDF